MRVLLACMISATTAATALAQSSISSVPRSGLLETYYAYIGVDDLYNSSGARLTRPWQIIRQDRANYHAYGIRQRGDTGDTFFADPVNRQKMEDMLSSGSITGIAARSIVQGNVMIRVNIYGRGSSGRWVDVGVFD